jgi:hypothetical protein
MESRAFPGWGGRPQEAAVLFSRKLTPLTHGIMLKKPAGFSFLPSFLPTFLPTYLPSYLPTQFTFLSLKTDGGTEVRPTSIATSPTRPNLEYAVRIPGSPFKRAFASLRPGDSVQVQGPFGRFLLKEDRLPSCSPEESESRLSRGWPSTPRTTASTSRSGSSTATAARRTSPTGQSSRRCRVETRASESPTHSRGASRRVGRAPSAG